MLLIRSRAYARRKACRNTFGMTTIMSIVGVYVALFLNAGISKAQSIDAQSVNLFPLNIVFLYPNPQSVTTIGNFNSGPVDLAFANNQLALDVSNNIITLANTSNASVSFPVQTAAIQFTTTNARDINAVVESLSTGMFDLRSGALEYGNNVVRVDLADAQIGPNSKVQFSVSTNAAVGEQAGAPVPLPPSLPVLASGLVALTAVRFGSRKWFKPHLA